MRPLLVGEGPSASAPPGERAFLPDRPGSGRRLAALLGVADVAELFDVENLLREHAWQLPLARRRADALLRSNRWTTIVLAGRRVAEAFNVPTVLLRWYGVAGIRIGVVPHPSGRSRWWNDPERTEAARRFLLDATLRDGQ